MKYLFFLIAFLLTSCFSTRTISYDPSYNTTPVSTITTYTYVPPPRPFGWWWRPTYFYKPRPIVNYAPYYIPPRPFYAPPPRPRTNLPLNNHSGPRGGRRK